jgi:hypothetical protein
MQGHSIIGSNFCQGVFEKKIQDGGRKGFFTADFADHADVLNAECRMQNAK